MSEVLLNVQNMDVHYRNFQAIYGVSMGIEKGKITSIIGANGAGKTTLLKAICGLIKPTNGKVFLHGEDITCLRTSKIAAKGVIMSPEGGEIFPAMSVKENLLMGAYLP
jgi:branched-chain amino acid transport system ATP-binding protein